MDSLTPVAQSLPEVDLAAAVARRRLASRLSDHPVAPLRDLVQMGRAVGLSVAEMQRVTGVARQTVYRQLPGTGDTARNPSKQQAVMEVLMLLAAEGGFASPDVLARDAGLAPATVAGLLGALAHDGFCELRKDNYTRVEARPTDKAYRVLREHFDDLFLRRPDGVSIYLRIHPGEEGEVARAAATVVEDLEFTVIEQWVAPSTMVGPEFAFNVNAPTVRRALDVAREVWSAVCAARGLSFTEPVFSNVISPGGRGPVASPVLDAFLEAIVDAGAPNGDEARQARDAFAGDASESTLAGRCVTMAALALRRAVGNTNDPRLIADGESAFDELEPASGVPVRPAARPVKEAAVAALDLAVENLGPLPGGRLGSVRAPDSPPVLLEEREPADDELVEMAGMAGQAVGAAASEHYVDAASLVRRVITGAR